MKIPVCFLVALLFATVGSRPSDAAEPGPSPSASPAVAAPTEASKKALDKFADALQSGGDVTEAAAAARKAGVPAQTMEEFQLLTAVRARKLDAIARHLKEVEEKILPGWRLEHSVAFADKTELEAVVAFAKALLAADGNDEGAFEQSIKQAFWLNPDLSPALSEEIKAIRSAKRTALVTLPMGTAFEKSEGGQISLGSLAEGQKALLLDFWATWCGPCISAFPSLVKRAQELAPQKVAVVGINTEAAGGLEEARKKTENMRKQKKIPFAWLIEPADEPLSRLLKIDSIPRAVLVSPEGKVLYDGHPEDPRLVTVLRKLGVSLPD